VPSDLEANVGTSLRSGLPDLGSGMLSEFISEWSSRCDSLVCTLAPTGDNKVGVDATALSIGDWDYKMGPVRATGWPAYVAALNLMRSMHYAIHGDDQGTFSRNSFGRLLDLWAAG